MPHITIDKLYDKLMRERIGPQTKMQCKVCWYIYDPQRGCEEFDIPEQTSFNDLPPDFTCPHCGSPKSGFLPLPDDQSEG